MGLTKKEKKRLDDYEKIKIETESQKHKEEKVKITQKYNSALQVISKLQKEIDIVRDIKEHQPNIFNIVIKESTHTSEATANMIMSDFHCEETIDPQAVNNLNEYNLTIAKKRAITFFHGGLRLTEIQRTGVKIDNLVLGLLGDMISGNIHDDLKENNSLSATEALLFIQDIIISGIEFLLKEGKFKKIYVICKFGNHSRTTKEPRYSTDYKNNYEWLMFHQIKKYFEKEKRLEIIVPISYHYYFQIYNYKIRYHHGESIRYQGGVGGITIPVNKSIAQWNKSVPGVYLDCFGHFHQLFDGGNFICNGSGIGYNTYAIREKFSFEPPRQAFFLIDKKRGKTISCPIYLE